MSVRQGGASRGLWIAFALLLTACAPDISPDSYAVGSVGQVNRVIRGVIINARPVAISGTNSGVGSTAGALSGGTLGASAGESAEAQIIGAVAGAVAGGLAGALVEGAATSQGGWEYIVEAENGALITVVQGAKTPLGIGQRVLVVYGTRARIIPDQRRSETQE